MYYKARSSNSILDLNTKEERMMFIEIGKMIGDNQWGKLPKDDKEELLTKYVETSPHDLPNEFKPSRVEENIMPLFIVD